jgi:phosphoenolpyruvate synthase/pyruvate phosphate dikinase
MADIEINEAIFNLRREIEGLGDQNPELRIKLEALLNELEDRLEATDDENHLHLVENMKETVAQFEVEHPRMTGILNDLMVMLSNLGI